MRNAWSFQLHRSLLIGASMGGGLDSEIVEAGVASTMLGRCNLMC